MCIVAYEKSGINKLKIGSSSILDAKTFSK